IQNLYNTRQAGHSFLTWAGSSSLDTQAEQPYHDYLRKTWKSDMFPQQSSFASFDAFWDNCLYEGVLHIPQAAVATSFAANVAGAASKIKNPKTSGIEVNLYETVNLGDGSYADNPWLQEMPDPVMRTTWGNYLSVGISYDVANNSYKTFQDLTTSSKGYTDKAKIASGDKGGVLPVVNQFGQMPDTCSAGLGYGRTVISSVGQNTGVNLYSLCSINEDGLTQYWTEISVEKAGREDEFACVQYHHTMGITGNDSKGEKINVDEEVEAYQGSLTTRTIIRSTNVENLDTFVDDLVHERQHHQKLNSYTLYPGHDSAFKMGHHWAMHVDLNSCTGCGACTVACMAENNVPVVGKKEVHRHHEMTWLRIDRYYYGDANNPNTVYQPMMCQHCDNAPCENVCPVAATNHSSEGLNQMTYNRCIGTRYCANNCP
ncbi:MAG: 4Fe-4S dicluster domain-containing protein, partial [Saprospiraceae bacterium]